MREIIWSSSLILLSDLLVSSAIAQPSPPLWGGLRAGPHSVGFRSTWQLDHGRRYNMVFEDGTRYAEGKAPRPILINLWFPARLEGRPAPMRHRDYLSIGSDDPQLARFAAKLVEYERATVCKYLMGKKPGELSGEERQLLEDFWDTPTAAYRDTPEQAGRFPLVIYHAGAGSSYEDNAVYCEFLASHGYVVLGSAFQRDAGDDFNVDAGDGSARDFEFLMAYASRLPNVDWQHVGLVGHSAGAHASLYSRAHEASAVDAVVSLDTTQDYFSIATHGWDDLVKYLLDHVENMNGPILMAANDHAVFQLADALVKADRYYLITHELGHEEFVAQGIIYRLMGCRLRPGDQAARSAYETARAQYEAVCEQARLFLDAQLKRDPARLASLAREVGTGPDAVVRPHLIHVPRGVSGPEPYRPDSPDPPTPRQLRELFARAGVEATLAILRRYREARPFGPVFHGRLGFAIVDEFYESGRISDAIAVYRFYQEFDPGPLRQYFREGLLYEKHGLKRQAIEHFNKALLMDPGDAEAAAHLKNLQASSPPAPTR